MIISVSRRTDIPAFYSTWFMNRIRAGFCHVANPYNPRQVTRVSLLPADVDALVFTTKNPAPLLPHLPELDNRGYRYYLMFTLNDYPTDMERSVPPLEKRLETFGQLSHYLGPERIIWRYDPIVISNRTDCHYHLRAFANLSAQLSGLTQKVIISVVDFYQKTHRRLKQLEQLGYQFDPAPLGSPTLHAMLCELRTIAAEQGMAIQSCCESLADTGIPAGPCIDAGLIQKLWGTSVVKKDPNQRKECCCATSKDIGANDTCLHGCQYCYAVRSDSLALARYKQHNPESSMLFGPSP